MQSILAALVLAALAAPATAQQDGDDWDLHLDEAQQVTLASVAYSSGQRIAVRCRAGTLDVILSGLPRDTDPTQYIEVTFADGRIESPSWFNSTDGALAFSSTPARFARRLRSGGRLQLATGPFDEPEVPMQRRVFDLPGRSTVLDRVLAACDVPLADARDDLVQWRMPRGEAVNFWQRMATPGYPSQAAAAGVDSGMAVLSCVVGAEGQMLDCRIERESQGGMGFGAAALRSMPSARLDMSKPAGPQPGQLVIGVYRFEVR